MSQARLCALEARIRDNIPLTPHLAFSLLDWDGQTLVMRAPLAENINDKGTMFAGSQSALLTLAGWACTTLAGESLLDKVDVVAVRSNLEYQAPVASDAQIEAVAEEPSLQRFRDRLPRSGRASLGVQARLLDSEGRVASRFTAPSMARRI